VKHPVLKVKKDAEKDVVFHSSREQRLALPSAPRGPSSVSGGFFRGFFRRGGRLPSLLPVLLMVLAAAVLLPRLMRTSSRATIAGYEAVLRASPYQDALLVSVTFASASGRKQAAPAPEVSVAFVLPDTGERLLVSELLEPGPSTLRGKMRYNGSEKKLTAMVRIGANQAVLSLGLPKR
jgi:hypothetical protein